ncbi:cupin domain-containing protein [Oceanomicrobium pacificus]|uniref:Cupin domain-containing protein n=1 Tax=Oceanomicrobium pacificus TaxID=2692916 RepID=A0A6B0TP11_9RHOB|nr:cupin domain-containing protein [Oceanomicrobium pacificus]MXU64329.1 cupin domain-containing protein [Oceanomicrobium pacificus]
MPDTDRYFHYPEDVDNFGFDWGRLALTVAPEVNGATQFSAGVVTVPPGQGHARHNHPGAEEIIFILEGRGEQMVEDETGTPVTREVGPGCSVFVPESRFHSTLNTGDETMRIFLVYAPAGPELALRDLPDFHIIPAADLT